MLGVEIARAGSGIWCRSCEKQSRVMYYGAWWIGDKIRTENSQQKGKVVGVTLSSFKDEQVSAQQAGTS